MSNSLEYWLRLRNRFVACFAIVALAQIFLLYPFFEQPISEMPKPWELGSNGFPADGKLDESVYPQQTMNQVFCSMGLAPVSFAMLLLAYWSWNKARGFKSRTPL